MRRKTTMINTPETAKKTMLGNDQLLPLTRADASADGVEVFVKASRVEAFHQSAVKGQENMTAVYMSAGNILLVKETVDQLLALLSKKI